MKYTAKQYPEVKVTVKEVKKDTILEHPEYGSILVTAGNYILTRSNGPQEGEQVAITKNDLELQYNPVDK
jgi:hypothetical protein